MVEYKVEYKIEYNVKYMIEYKVEYMVDDKEVQKLLLFASFVHVVRCKLEQRREGYDLACTRIRDDHSNPTFVIFITKSFGFLNILVPQVRIESIDFATRIITMKQIRAEQIRANPISDRIRVCVWRVVFLNTRSLVESCRACYYYQHLSLSKPN